MQDFDSLLVGTGLLIVQVLFLVYPIITRAVRKRFDALEIGVIFAFLYCLYSIPLGLSKLYFEPAVTGSTPALYLLVTSLGLASFWMGYESNIGHRLSDGVPALGPSSDTAIGVSALVLGLIGTVLLYLLYQSMGGLRAYLSIGYGGALQLAMVGKGYLAVGQDLIILALALLWLYRTLKRKFIVQVAFFAAAIPFLALRLSMGDRGSILAVALVTLTASHYLTQRFSKKKALLLLLTFYVAGVTFGVSRYWLVRQGLARLPQNVKTNFSSEWLLPYNIGEFTAPAGSLYDLIDHRTTLDYRYGATYLVFVENLLPKNFVPEQAPTAAEWYVSTFHPAVSEGGGGVGFFTAGEAFLNFGFVGPFLQFLIYGILLRAIYEYFKKQHRNPAAVFLYSICLFWIFPMVRIDLATALRGALIRGIIPGIMVALLIVHGRLAGQPRIMSGRPILAGYRPLFSTISSFDPPGQSSVNIGQPGGSGFVRAIRHRK